MERLHNVRIKKPTRHRRMGVSAMSAIVEEKERKKERKKVNCICRHEEIHCELLDLLLLPFTLHFPQLDLQAARAGK
jgi:hypothetical protein